jgi:non-ribosomal peptide synthetase component F
VNGRSIDLLAMLRDAFDEHWHRPALWKSGATRNYGEVWTSASLMAETLNARLSADQTVGILAQRSIPAYEGILASVLAGIPYVPINMKIPLDRQLLMARTARCATFISDPKSEARRLELSARLGQPDWRPQGEGISDARRRGAVIETAVEDGRVAYVMFTSGTTGTPKGVAVTRANLAAYLKAIAEIASIAPGSKCTQLFELSFDL